MAKKQRQSDPKLGRPVKPSKKTQPVFVMVTDDTQAKLRELATRYDLSVMR